MLWFVLGVAATIAVAGAALFIAALFGYRRDEAEKRAAVSRL